LSADNNTTCHKFYLLRCSAQIYEKKEIEKWMRLKGTRIVSPVTKQRMGDKLLPAYHVSSVIQLLIERGDISGEIGETWTERMETKKFVGDTKMKAEGGDPDAMRLLAYWYTVGENELEKDVVLARQWDDKATRVEKKRLVEQMTREAEAGDSQAMYKLAKAYFGRGTLGVFQDDSEAYKWAKKAADAGNVKGMALFGFVLINGVGTEVCLSDGVALLASAAERGSDYACHLIGTCYRCGCYGFRKDCGKAKYWMEKAIGGSCRHNSLSETQKAKAREWLQRT